MDRTLFRFLDIFVTIAISTAMVFLKTEQRALTSTYRSTFARSVASCSSICYYDNTCLCVSFYWNTNKCDLSTIRLGNVINNSLFDKDCAVFSKVGGWLSIIVLYREMFKISTDFIYVSLRYPVAKIVERS